MFNETFLVANSIAGVELLDVIGDKLHGVFYTKHPDIDLVEKCSKLGLPLFDKAKLLELTEANVIMLECHVIIPEHVFVKGNWINIHAGLLPKWRGYSANSWALLNDEPYLGFTIHQIEKDFDSGRILKYILLENDYSSNYSTLRSQLISKLCSEICPLIPGLFTGEIIEERYLYDEFEARYCAKMKKTDGIIRNFDMETKFIFNLSRLYLREESSDFCVEVNHKQYEISGAVPLSKEYSGIPGKILKVDSDWVLVKTYDSAIWLRLAKSQEFVQEVRRLL